MTPFETSHEHILAELERIDLLVRARIAHLRQLHTQDEHFRGLYISEQEIDALLAQPRGRPTWLRAADNEWLSTVNAELQERSRALDEHRGAACAQGIALRLPQLQQSFGLTSFEVDVLLVCLAGELELRYERLYAYLQDDVTRKRPSVELAIQLLTTSESQRLAARNSFNAEAPLLAHKLVYLLDDATQLKPPLLARYLKIDDRIVQHLLENDAVDERLREAVEISATGTALDALRLREDTRRAIRCVWSRPLAEDAPVLVLRGPSGAGKRSIAQALCQELKRPLIVVDAAVLVAENVEGSAPSRSLAAHEWRERIALVEREALLRGSVILWRGFTAMTNEKETSQQFAAVLRAIDQSHAPCIVSTQESLDAANSFPRRSGVAIDLKDTTHEHRLVHWAASLADQSLGSNVDLEGLATRFKLSLGEIQRAARTAGHLARLHGGEPVSVTQRDLLEACRLHSNQKLGKLASKIPPHFSWNDIVLPADCMEQLREICNQVKYRDQVYGTWGFGRKLALGKGLTVLFAGPSGTGKTMSAGIIAGELGLDLYKIDLSTVISKYIGETEKNLARIFDEAETSNAILFFDEADALFGKRSEVRDSHDRYANIEVGFLLQRMEEYEGLAILATNYRRNMDDAFARRLQFALEFPFPDTEHRHRIWQGIWPKDTPRAASLDLRLLAERYEMSGGNIKNVAVAAAFLAADGGKEVCMTHVIHAVRREYQKTGKLTVEEGDFAVERSR